MTKLILHLLLVFVLGTLNVNASFRLSPSLPTLMSVEQVEDQGGFSRFQLRYTGLVFIYDPTGALLIYTPTIKGITVVTNKIPVFLSIKIPRRGYYEGEIHAPIALFNNNGKKVGSIKLTKDKKALEISLLTKLINPTSLFAFGRVIPITIKTPNKTLRPGEK